MKLYEEKTTHFEDRDDYFDYVIDKIRLAIREWIILCDIEGIGEDKNLTLDHLLEIASAEFEHQYPKTFGMIKNNNNSFVIYKMVVFDNENCED